MACNFFKQPMLTLDNPSFVFITRFKYEYNRCMVSKQRPFVRHEGPAAQLILRTSLCLHASDEQTKSSAREATGSGFGYV